MISVLIPVRNEARDLPGCLASVAWSDDVHVYDGYSSDASEAIALAAGARVVRRPYDPALGAYGGDEALHRNWALANIEFRHRWVLHVDADERVTPALRDALHAAVAGDGVAHGAFRIRRRDFLYGRWLRHVQASPWFVRLFRPERVRYERLINPVVRVDGSIGELAGYLDHHPFSKGLAHWLERHNVYSTLEARQIVEDRARGASFSALAAFLERDPTRRRFHQKELFYRLPLRPLAKFVLLYAAKRGFLDGRAGFDYALLQSIYEQMIVMKTRELERAARLEPPAAAAGALAGRAVHDARPGSAS